MQRENPITTFRSGNTQEEVEQDINFKLTQQVVISALESVFEHNKLKLRDPAFYDDSQEDDGELTPPARPEPPKKGKKRQS